MRHLIVGIILIAISVFDFFTFKYLPIERKLWIRDERTFEENAIREHTEDKAVIATQKVNFRTHSVSYMSVLRVKEVQLMIIAGGLKNVANEIAFQDIGLTADFDLYN
jgi:hypothetical protein